VTWQASSTALDVPGVGRSPPCHPATFPRGPAGLSLGATLAGIGWARPSGQRKPPYPLKNFCRLAGWPFEPLRPSPSPGRRGPPANASNHAHSCQAEEAEHPRTEEVGRADFSRRRRLRSYFDKLGTRDTGSLKGLLDLFGKNERFPSPSPKDFLVADF